MAALLACCIPTPGAGQDFVGSSDPHSCPSQSSSEGFFPPITRGCFCRSVKCHRGVFGWHRIPNSWRSIFSPRGAAPVPAVTRGALGCRYSPSSSSRQTAMQRSCLHSMAGGVPKTRRSLFPVQRDPAGTAPGLLSPAAALSSCGLVGVQAFEITHL